MTNTHRITVIPGDGIGTEVVPEGLRALVAAAAAFDQYVNLRPVRSTPGVRSPLAGREPGDVDFDLAATRPKKHLTSTWRILELRRDRCTR